MNKINELLEKAKQDSKKGLLKEEQKQYRTELFECLRQNGMNDENIFYLVAGVKFGSMITFINWNRELPQEIQCENYNMLTNSPKVKSVENVSKLRLYLTLLIGELNEKDTNDYIIGDILHSVVGLSFKKDGSRLTDLGKIFKMCFVSGMKTGTTLPAIKKYNFGEAYENQLVQFFDEAIKGIDPKGDEEIDKRNILRAWLKKEAEGIVNSEETSSKVVSGEVVSEKQSVVEKTDDAKTGQKDPEMASSLAKRLVEIARVIDSFEQQMKETEALVRQKEKEISKLKTSLDKIEGLYQAGSEENSSLRKQTEELKMTIQSLTEKNDELEARVSRQVSVIDVYDQDKANTKTEVQNQIAAALKKIYEDYKTAQGMEMTIDLGENMRDSLDDVFRKLKKLGVDVEGR